VSKRLYTTELALMHEMTQQGDVFELRRVGNRSSLPWKGGTRGKIEGFSQGARRRLIDLMARLLVDGVRVTFITLTFQGVPVAQDAKAALKRFTMRLRRRFPQASALWRMERQKRGSIHFHMIWFRLPFVPQAVLQTWWTQCTRETLSILDVRLVRGKRQAMSYVSKYVAKRSPPAEGASFNDGTYQHASQDDQAGKWWGIVNREALPMADQVAVLVEDGDLVEYARWMVQRMSRGRAAKSEQRTKLYHQDAGEVFSWAFEHCWQAGVECQRQLYQEAQFQAWNASGRAL
jgi:hypothetical protein